MSWSMFDKNPNDYGSADYHNWERENERKYTHEQWQKAESSADRNRSNKTNSNSSNDGGGGGIFGGIIAFILILLGLGD